jgi:glycosyltransferase involved in cell wall biosynthesis
VRDLLVEAHVPSRRIVLAENFLEEAPPGTTRARVSYRERPPGTSGPVRVIVVGRADEVKRLELVIDAVAEQGLTDMDIDVYGAGPLLEHLRSRAAPFANLTFRGYDADVATHMSRADLLLHTCPVETFGLVVLESFRAGVVPVVPDAGGTATLVEPGQTGFRYHAGDAADLVRSVRAAAAESPARLDDMVVAARELMRTRFSAEEGARVYRRAFAQLGG